MTYADVADLAADQDFARRVIACYAIETLNTPAESKQDPGWWQSTRAWVLAAQPGFADAYGYALRSDPPVERPGLADTVITDAQILTAVQSLLTPATPPPGEGTF